MDGKLGMAIRVIKTTTTAPFLVCFAVGELDYPVTTV
jgi:hypothetical protein